MKLARLGTAIVAGTALAFAGLPIAPAAAAPGSKLVVHVFDVGQGSCVLVECPDDLPILVDCGKLMRSPRRGQPPPGPTLSEVGPKLDAIVGTYRGPGARPLRVVISHADQDHYQLLAESGSHAVKAADVGTFLYGGKFADYPTPVRTFAQTVHRNATGSSAAYTEGPCTVGAAVSCFQQNESGFPTPRLSCGGAQVDLLTANAFAFYTANPGSAPAGLDSDRKKNPDSAVVRVRFRGVSFILTGDAQEVTEHFAVKNAGAAGASLAQTSFVFGSHHGSHTKGSNGPDWMAATSPNALVFSAHRSAGFGHPSCRVVTQFEAARYAGGGEMTKLSAPMTFPCGYPDATPGSVTHQFLSTQANGDMSITVDESGTTITCTRHNGAC